MILIIMELSWNYHGDDNLSWNVRISIKMQRQLVHPMHHPRQYLPGAIPWVRAVCNGKEPWSGDVP